MTCTEFTGTCPTRGQAYMVAEVDALRAALAECHEMLKSGIDTVRSQTARIAELERQRDESDNYGRGPLDRVKARDSRIDTLTRELAEAREELAKAKVRVSNQDALLVNCRANRDALKAELAAVREWRLRKDMVALAERLRDSAMAPAIHILEERLETCDPEEAVGMRLAIDRLRGL